MNQSAFGELLDQVSALSGLGSWPGVGASDIEALEQRLGQKLPADAATFVSRFNGAREPTSVDQGWVEFWPIKRWERVEHHSQARVGSGVAPAILFADHGAESWWYAWAPDGSGQSSLVYKVDGVGPDRLVAHSIVEFIRAVLNNDAALYLGLQQAG